MLGANLCVTEGEDVATCAQFGIFKKAQQEVMFPNRSLVLAHPTVERSAHRRVESKKECFRASLSASKNTWCVSSPPQKGFREMFSFTAVPCYGSKDAPVWSVTAIPKKLLVNQQYLVIC
uniref:Uncharacterized protein n=1 Tax=Sphaerodactylus townsendi TaxID=933632 RepID=A0ACB8F6X4_9SAUR